MASLPNAKKAIYEECLTTTVEVLLLENGFLRSVDVLTAGALQPKLFPHVHVNIAQIWPD
jgi:hypothetical protein